MHFIFNISFKNINNVSIRAEKWRKTQQASKRCWILLGCVTQCEWQSFRIFTLGVRLCILTHTPDGKVGWIDYASVS